MYKLFIVLLILTLLGCESRLDKAGYDHARDVIAWRELANYTNSELYFFGVTISASIQLEETPDGTSYRLLNIKLSDSSTSGYIDLFSP